MPGWAGIRRTRKRSNRYAHELALPNPVLPRRRFSHAAHIILWLLASCISQSNGLIAPAWRPVVVTAVHHGRYPFATAVLVTSVADAATWDYVNATSSSSLDPASLEAPAEGNAALLWQTALGPVTNPYRSPLFDKDNGNGHNWGSFLDSLRVRARNGTPIDPFWEQIKLEAFSKLELEPDAGPQIYQGILSQPSLLTALVTILAHEVATELMPAPALKNLFLELLTANDEHDLRLDLQAVASRSAGVPDAMSALLFHNGLHALVCYRVAHRLWQQERRGLACYLQSTVSRIYSADIHPACTIGHGLYLRCGSGIVIGETTVIGNDVSILEGATLGGTGKEAGDRHPKVGNGVIIYDGGTVLGNIPVGDGSVVAAKSIVTKPVPALAIVSGIPSKVDGYRVLTPDCFLNDGLQAHLAHKYLTEWRKLEQAILSDNSTSVGKRLCPG